MPLGETGAQNRDRVIDTSAFIDQFINRVYDASLAESNRDSLYLIHFQLIDLLRTKERYKDQIHVMNSLVILLLEDGREDQCPPILAEQRRIPRHADYFFIDMICALSHSYYYEEIGQLDSTIYFKNTALNVAETALDTFHQILIGSQLVDVILINERDTTGLLALINDQILLAKRWDQESVLMRTLLRLKGEYYLVAKQYQRAIQHLNASLDLDENRLSEHVFNMKQKLAKAHQALGHITLANQLLSESLELVPIVFNEERDSRVQQLLHQLENSEQQRQLDHLQGEREMAQLKQRRRNLLYGAGILLSLFLVSFLVILVRQYRSRQQSDAEVIRLQQEVGLQKARFYTNLTHEFRTPLTVILGMAKKLGHQSDLQKVITRNANHLLELVNQLLDFSKLDKNLLQLKMMHGDVASYINYLTESFYSLANERDIRMVCVDGNEPIMMDYDPDKIRQIHQNIVSNALKYTERGGKVIVLLKHQDDRLVWETSDTGIGIPEDQLHKIFERFYQVPESKMSNVEGTGIGLSYVRELVLLMAGEISVTSKEGKGTKVTISLPIKNEYHNEPHSVDEFISIPTSTEYTASAPLSQDADKPSVLIVEDNKDVAHYISTCLEESYRILMAHNGEEGMDICVQEIPDVVISDIMMPKMNGYELVQLIKKDLRTHHIPILLLTAKATAEDRIKGLEFGADDYITKPFEENELKVKVKNFLSLRDAIQQSITQESSTLSTKDVFLSKLNQVLEENYQDTQFTTARLCRHLGMSRMQLHRKLKAMTNLATATYIREFRLKKARKMLLDKTYNISEIAYDCGFSDPSHFSKLFSQRFGKSPSMFRDQSKLTTS